ncbi:hypothetical protein IFM89_015069 [Coptis chinensis]|uniref:Pentatricopeptide repeat-containing protein n=1 Tax=Coptis chinensis TaxID=261450 RepID=A0A835H8L6_9MAGN|nr:hypothetical protein IFM89_015069 [Coptis chinensis]
MMERLVKASCLFDRFLKHFKGLEAFDRKPPEKSIVQKVANAYEMLGLLEEKNRVLDKFNDLFTDTWRGHPKKSKKTSGKKLEKPEQRVRIHVSMPYNATMLSTLSSVGDMRTEEAHKYVMVLRRLGIASLPLYKSLLRVFVQVQKPAPDILKMMEKDNIEIDEEVCVLVKSLNQINAVEN